MAIQVHPIHSMVEDSRQLSSGPALAFGVRGDRHENGPAQGPPGRIGTEADDLRVIHVVCLRDPG